MHGFSFFPFFFCFFFFFQENFSFAARYGKTVNSLRTESFDSPSLQRSPAGERLSEILVYEEPSHFSKVIERLPIATALEASNFPTQGFHKVRTPSGTLGWVEAQLLNLESPPTLEELKVSQEPVPEVEKRAKDQERMRLAHRREKEQKQEEEAKKKEELFWIKGFGSFNLFRSAGIVLNSNRMANGYGYGTEMVVMVSRRFGLGIRLEILSQSISSVTQNTKSLYTVGVKGIPLMLGVDTFLIGGRSLSLRLSCFFGASFQTGLRIMGPSSASFSKGGLFLSSPVFTVLEKLELHWYYNNWLSAFFNLGYRYLESKTITTPPSVSEVVNPTMNVSLSGFFFSGGLALGF